MLVNHQYRAYPNTNQKLTLNHWLRIYQYWYNWQLGERFKWWSENRSDYVVPGGEFCVISCTLPPSELREKPNYYSQKKLLPIFKKDLIKSFSQIYSIVFYPDCKCERAAFLEQFATGDFLLFPDYDASGQPLSSPCQYQVHSCFLRYQRKLR